MSNDHLPVFLYRWTDQNDIRDASTIAFGEERQFSQHFPSTVIGVATRPVGTTIDHMDATPEYAEKRFGEFRERVEEVADDVRWFDAPLECDTDE